MSSLRRLLPKSLLVSKAYATPVKVLGEEEPLENYRPGGYHPVHIGDAFDDGRFTVVRKLGWGQHSTVWLAKDSKDGRHVALKILTHNSSRPGQSFDEVPLLSCIKESAPTHPGRGHVSLMKDRFKHVGPNGTHVCIVFEVLGPSVCEIQRLYEWNGLPQFLVRRVAAQMLLALDLLHQSCGIIHSNVKPDNMLLVCRNAETTIRYDRERAPARVHMLEKLSRHKPVYLVESQPLKWPSLLDKARHPQMHFHVKLTDFGVANWVDKQTVDVIGPMALRAPEVILGAKWGPSAEIWSLGCLIYTLWSGNLLINPEFAAEHNVTEEKEILVQVTTLLGDVPAELIKAGTRSKKFYDGSGKLSSIVMDGADFKLEKLIEMNAPRDLPAADLNLFADFLSRMVKILPQERDTPAQLLRHPWLQEVDSGTGAVRPP